MNKLIAGGLLSLVLAFPAACALSKTTCEDAGGTTGADGTCVEAADGGSSSGGASSSSSSGGGDGGGPTACDFATDASCIDDGKGVFVRAGAVGGQGTRAAPFGTIAAGLAGRAGKERVYVCKGDYAEAVAITSGAVTLVGGLDCTTFASGGGKSRVLVAPPLRALDVSGGAKAALVDLTFEAQDAPALDGAAPPGTAGVSSIAAFVHGGAEVTATRAHFVAGNGSAGKAGEDQGVQPASGNGKAGSEALATGGGPGGASTCGSVGGAGGRGASFAAVDASKNGTPQTTVGAKPFGLRGCASNEDGPGCVDALTCGSGFMGIGGTGGVAPVAATSVGVLGDGSWSPAPGAAGAAGGDGGGGGGGGQNATAAPGGNGGGGGGGGCGGLAGGGGGGGGASLAVLLHDAKLSATASSITLGSAGAGGKGGAGGGGGDGGGSGTGVCNGGAGGAGGGGAGGQGGAAGVAAGVLYNSGGSLTWGGLAVLGTKPTLEQVTLPSSAALPGEAGALGAAGASPGEAGAQGAAGAAGTPGPALAPAAAIAL